MECSLERDQVFAFVAAWLWVFNRSTFTHFKAYLDYLISIVHKL